MRILVFCDSLKKILEIHRAFVSAPSAQLQYLICNHSRRLKLVYFALKMAHGLRRLSLRDWLLLLHLFRTKKIWLSPHPLSSLPVISWLKKESFDIGFHAMGVIYKKEVLDTFKLGIINPHIGKLPEMRGRCVMEWSILFNIPTGITSFVIDTGIDTGPKMLFFEPVEILEKASIDRAKNFLFSKNTEIFRKSFDFLFQETPFLLNDVEQGKRYYVMSQFLLDIVSEKL